MRCTAVENLLPLYVEGDLAEDEMRRVRAHLSSCGACRLAEEDFRASQSLVHAFGAPAFDEEFYESLRGRVMSEISTRRSAPAPLLQTARALFLSRPAVAAAFASIVICAALLVFYHKFSDSGSHPVAIEKLLREINPNQYAEAAAQENTAAPGRRAGIERGRQASPYSGNPLRKTPTPVIQKDVKQEGLARERTYEAPAMAQTTTPDNSASVKAAPAQAVARIEIQTSDPNIRIIWLGR